MPKTAPEPPKLLLFLFGEAAGTVLPAASPRLLPWCQAFDDWIAERRQTCHSTTARGSLTAWKQFLAHCPRLPWEVEPDDLRGFVAHLQALGRAPNTIRYAMAKLSTFYAWCDRRRIDPLCPPAFNPVAEIERPPGRPPPVHKALTLAEVHSLLGLMRRDASPLGQRDYAFFLARLYLGLKPERIRKLK